jgi:isoquinoline 1-oxidoreductase beta subunit
MGKVMKYTRRAFLGIGILAAGGFAVGYYYYRKPYANPLEGDLDQGEVTFNAYVKIASDGTVTIIAPRAEMGQGVQTTLAALVAEELDVALDKVIVEHGPPSPAYYNEAMLKMGGPFPWFDDSFMAEATRSAMGVVSKFLGLQVTGGSSATIDAFEKMRAAGAAAREMLKLAAAKEWGVDAATLRTGDGAVLDPGGGRTLTYGTLAVKAAQIDPPSGLELRPRSQWKLLGKPQNRVEGREKVTGGRIFGIDVQLPDMLYATVKISPRFGVGAQSADKADALKVKGVIAVEEIKTTTGQGFGVIAENTWAAFKGAEALKVTWAAAPYPGDDAAQGALFKAALDGGEAFELGGAGDAEAAFASAQASEIVEADYAAPFLAHACMEPMNATARFKDGKLEIWLGTQAPGIVQMVCASLLGIESEDVTVHTTHLGGGFGRRGEADFPLYAAALAARTDGRPVKVTWTREEDTRHDAYRPRAAARMRAVIRDGEAVALDVRAASVSIIKSVITRTFPSFPAPPDDDTILDGLFNQPMGAPNRRYRGAAVDLPVPVGFWRSVGNSQNGFFHECFIDEMAAKAGRDPLDFRLGLLKAPEFAPARGVLRKAAEMSGWGGAAQPGRAKGIAHMLSFGTWVAQVVQVAAGENGAIRIEKVWCAADPGLVLDPRNFEAQIISGIVFGLSQALGQRISFKDGEVQESNFFDFDAMRMAQAPEIEVAILETAPKMGGAGEPGTPPALPALANAIFALTGKRIRSMPLSDEVTFV